MDYETKIYRLGNEPTVVSTFYTQDQIILEKVNPNNREKAKVIIALFGLTHSLDEIFKKYSQDPESMRIELLKFAIEREKFLTEATKNL